MRRQALAIWIMSVFSIGALKATDAVADYKLGADDKLSVKVYEWPDLTGDFSVGANGAVALPIVGEVKAAGLSPGELGADIARVLQQKANLGQSPSVIVEVKQYRPFYIIGDVQKPGEFPYRPSMTVLQAVSIAGGYYRLTDPGLLRLERDAITHRGEVRILALKRDQLEAQRARLLAELNDRATVEFSNELVRRQGEAAVSQLLDEQRIIFETSRKAFAEATEGLRTQIELLEKEIASLGIQAESEKRQLRAVQKELDEVQSLSSRGLAPTARLTLLERTAAQIVGQQQSLETMILRARQSIVQTGQKISDLRNDRRKATTVELQKTNADLNDVLQQATTAELLILEAELTAPQSLASLRNSSRETSFAITRRIGSEMRDIGADGTTEVEPGDVILVNRTMVTSDGALRSRPNDPSVAATDGKPGTTQQ